MEGPDKASYKSCLTEELTNDSSTPSPNSKKSSHSFHLKGKKAKSPKRAEHKKDDDVHDDEEPELP